MKVIKTPLEGALIIEPEIFGDERGYFFESFSQHRYHNLGLDIDFVQDNESYSKYGVVRGLHAQKDEFAQAKLVRAITGKVLDVIVDNRADSLTRGKHLAVELSALNKRQLFIPRGFLHGFAVLSEDAIFAYKCDNDYHHAAEIGVNLLDKDLNIDWKIPRQDMIISVKDQNWGNFKDVTHYRC